MHLKPDNRWQWYFDSEQDSVVLDMKDGSNFASRFSSKMLIPDAFCCHPFCVDDASLFEQFAESCLNTPLDNAQTQQLIINSLVAYRFLKPQMPKSWHFVSRQYALQPAVGDMVVAELTSNGEEALLLVIETNPQASLCIVAQPEMLLNSGKALCLGDAIKIMNDRLLTWHAEPSLLLEKVG
ncbi:cell division protein ZapC [Tatumella sp. TA1]|uniref:cell division protein ZapC n=1 Tax=Rosenbergiella collisarenosi TaxID=1544695 RepID=UPI0008F91DA9|nr:cell division protein ZapC [Rosenbergiella collisarenosi]MBT0722038.1 cell division protein ZapC [Rosenbergiella collisarenosi]QGX91080.1 cell division protein ZapC [Tatumella sp. TA1]